MRSPRSGVSPPPVRARATAGRRSKNSAEPVAVRTPGRGTAPAPRPALPDADPRRSASSERSLATAMVGRGSVGTVPQAASLLTSHGPASRWATGGRRVRSLRPNRRTGPRSFPPPHRRSPIRATAGRRAVRTDHARTASDAVRSGSTRPGTPGLRLWFEARASEWPADGAAPPGPRRAERGPRGPSTASHLRAVAATARRAVRWDRIPRISCRGGPCGGRVIVEPVPVSPGSRVAAPISAAHASVGCAGRAGLPLGMNDRPIPGPGSIRARTHGTTSNSMK